MGLTKEQKDGVIQCLYGPMFDYIESIAQAPKSRISFWSRLLGRVPDETVKLTAHQLNIAAIYDYSGKAKFEARVLAILDAYLEGRVQKDALPNTQPVVDGAAIAERRTHFKRDALNMLAEFDWSSLKGEDYAAARKAWWYHDFLRDMCAGDAETWAAYKKAREEAKID